MHIVFTEANNGFALTAKVNTIEKTMKENNLSYTLNLLSDKLVKPHHLIEMAQEKSSPLIIVNRDGKGSGRHIPILTNKHHIEVVCLY